MVGTPVCELPGAGSKLLVLLTASAAIVLRVLTRLLGGASLESIRLADFLCLEGRVGDSAASSADASREEG